MLTCFHGSGGGNSRITKSVGFIVKSMKALSLLKVKTAGDGHPRAPRRHRRWHRRRSPEADELQDKDVTAASSSASSSAKIAPAQPHEATAVTFGETASTKTRSCGSKEELNTGTATSAARHWKTTWRRPPRVRRTWQATRSGRRSRSPAC
ncbi:hypothetical protein Zm00014a_001164 [Zea mays]|uniref:Uncharacterized protein n=2 Tax=Zea mays TaxID=4577 RepID=A0A1D6H371_MAIZE|nr:hypothetical protein ZEAMMB73_Zm00001d015679 [Zea mays]PWZ25002.1 hypothetical protein Zm00014a_001164 [Zea mays]